jgi:predicted porin
VLFRGEDSTSFWDVQNNSSRIGVKGSEDLGNGLSAIYQYEFGVDATDGGNLNSNRPKWIGLESDQWGRIKLGTQWTPYYNVAGAADQFNNSKLWDTWDTRKCLIATNPPTGNTLWQPDAGRGCGTTYLGPNRYDNAITYQTPNWNGFSAEGMLIIKR